MATAASVHRQLIDALNARDWEAFAALLHPEYRYLGPDGVEYAGGPEAGLSAARDLAQAYDLTLDIWAMYAHGEVSIAELTGRGTAGEAPLCDIVELRDGKICCERGYFDVAKLFAAPN